MFTAICLQLSSRICLGFSATRAIQERRPFPSLRLSGPAPTRCQYSKRRGPWTGKSALLTLCLLPASSFFRLLLQSASRLRLCGSKRIFEVFYYFLPFVWKTYTSFPHLQSRSCEGFQNAVGMTVREESDILCYGLHYCLLSGVQLKLCVRGEWLPPVPERSYVGGFCLSSSPRMNGSKVLAREVSWEEELAQQGGKALLWPGIKDVLNEGCPCLNSTGSQGRIGGFMPVSWRYI